MNLAKHAVKVAILLYCFTITIAYLMLLGEKHIRATTSTPGAFHTAYKIEVITNPDVANGFWVRSEIDGKLYWMKFCSDTRTKDIFHVGTIFEELKYEDRGVCYSLSSDEAKFRIRRS